MMGPDGLREASKVAILNANYIAARLSNHFPTLYKGPSGLVAHECILDVRALKTSAGVEVGDIAKRLMDYGFHAPTVSFPVAGTMMVEPTESESKQEIDRFCDAMISIRKEIEEIEAGVMDRQDNLLKNAPHTAEALMASEWNHPYPRERAAYPAWWVREHKFWPATGRIDDVFGNHTRPPGAEAVLAKFRANAARSLKANAVGALELAVQQLGAAADLKVLSAAVRQIR